jgi:hypothetical protein
LVLLAVELGDPLLFMVRFAIANCSRLLIVNGDHESLLLVIISLLPPICHHRIVQIQNRVQWLLGNLYEVLVVFDDPSKSDWVSSFEERVLELDWMA